MKSRVQRGQARLRELVLTCCEVQRDVRGRVQDYAPGTRPADGLRLLRVRPGQVLAIAAANTRSISAGLGASKTIPSVAAAILRNAGTSVSSP